MELTEIDVAVNLGRAFDRQDELLSAAWAYEAALRLGCVDPEVWLDLLVLYLTLDTGYVTSRRLPDELVVIAAERVEQMRHELGRMFQSNHEASVWRRYLESLLGDGEGSHADSFAGIIDIYLEGNETDRMPQITARQRYVKSIAQARGGWR